MVPSLWKKVLLSRMRESKMPDVMAECSGSYYIPPIAPIVISNLRNQVADVGMNVFRIGHNIKDARGELHHTQRVLEPAVSCPRIDKVR